MSGKKRVLSTLKGKPVGATPVAAFYAMEGGVELANFTRKDIRIDPAKYVTTCALMQDLIHSDIVLAAGDDMLVVTQAAPELGLSQQEITERNRQAKPLLDDKADLDKLSADYLDETEGRFAYYMELCRGLNETVTDALPVVSLYAPWTMATMLRGIENLIYDTIDDPEFVHRILRRCTEICKSIAASIASTGVVLLQGDPAAG